MSRLAGTNTGLSSQRCSRRWGSDIHTENTVYQAEHIDEIMEYWCAFSDYHRMMDALESGRCFQFKHVSESFGGLTATHIVEHHSQNHWIRNPRREVCGPIVCISNKFLGNVHAVGLRSAVWQLVMSIQKNTHEGRKHQVSPANANPVGRILVPEQGLV